MKFLFAIVAFAVAVSVTDGQSDDEAWRQYKVSKLCERVIAI